MTQTVYAFSDPWGDYEYTREQILEAYWEYWREKMRDRGFSEDRITEEACIEDWIVVNFATKKEIEV